METSPTSPITEQYCDGGHAGFGAHIQEAYDSTLNANVFRFISHAAEDIDCAGAGDDRQRLQVDTSTFGSSDTWARENDWMTYKWNFFLSEDFRISSAGLALFQLNVLGGNGQAMSVILARTLGGENKIVFTHNPIGGTADNVATDNFENYNGRWINAFVRSRSSNENGLLQFILREASSGNTIAHYIGDDLDMWRDSGTGQRSSWGIYRFFNGHIPLKDEEMLIDSICIAKGSGRCPAN